MAESNSDQAKSARRLVRRMGGKLGAKGTQTKAAIEKLASRNKGNKAAQRKSKTNRLTNAGGRVGNPKKTKVKAQKLRRAKARRARIARALGFKKIGKNKAI